MFYANNKESQCNHQNLSSQPSSARRSHPAKDSSVPGGCGPNFSKMKWFKHETSAVKNEKIQSLMDDHGIAGYGIYFILVELCAEKVDQRLNPEINIKWPFIEYLTHSRRSTIRRVLDSCATAGLLVWESNDQQMVCRIPKLLKRLDNWTKRSVVTSEQLPLEEEEEEEEEEKKNKNKKASRKKYGEYKHVLLTDKQLEDLKEEFGEDKLKGLIKLVDEGVERKGYRYKNFKLVIKAWSKNWNFKQGEKPALKSWFFVVISKNFNY